MFPPNSGRSPRQLPKPHGGAWAFPSPAGALISHLRTNPTPPALKMPDNTSSNSSSSLNPNADVFQASAFDTSAPSMNVSPDAQAYNPADLSKSYSNVTDSHTKRVLLSNALTGRTSGAFSNTAHPGHSTSVSMSHNMDIASMSKQESQQITLAQSFPFDLKSDEFGSYTYPNIHPSYMGSTRKVYGGAYNVQQINPYHMSIVQSDPFTSHNSSTMDTSGGNSGHGYHGCQIKQVSRGPASHSQPPQLRLRSLQFTNNKSFNRGISPKFQGSSASSSSGITFHNTLRGPGNALDEIDQGYRESFQPQSMVRPSPMQGTAHQLSTLIMDGITESPYENYDPPKSPKARPTNPSYTPVRFTSDKARRASLAIDEDQILESKSYAPRWAYAYAAKPPLPDWFGPVLENNYWPTQAEAKKALPITDLCRMTGPGKNGVIKITDFPYATTKAEIIAFIGRNAKIATQPLGSPYFAIHIILERESGKTNECYIEIETPNDANWLVRQFKKRDSATTGRMPKIGDRDVQVELSSQEALCDALFPRAKNVRWIGEIPIAIDDPNPYFEEEQVAGFQGFFSAEEQYHITKWGDNPERNPFINRSPTRAYENLISVLHKYPWFEHELITLAERRRVYDSTRSLLKALMERLAHQDRELQDPREPSAALLQELAIAALSCPGFSERQKCVLARDLYHRGHADMAISNKHTQIPLGGTHPFSKSWPFIALSVSPAADMRLVEFYGTLFNDATILRNPSLRASRSEIIEQHPMGFFDLDFGPEEHALNLTLAEAARVELHAIDQMLKEVLPVSHWSYGVEHDALVNLPPA